MYPSHDNRNAGKVELQTEEASNKNVEELLKTCEKKIKTCEKKTSKKTKSLWFVWKYVKNRQSAWGRRIDS